jgi:tRNA threonylcarbamoyl adenosine modification protein (Sua5/YciO/YrdC/YwlC family)
VPTLLKMQRLDVHPLNPQARHIAKAAASLRAGSLVIYPTDTTYGMGCDLFAKRAVERIYTLKAKPRSQPLSFLCADLSELARYAVVDNRNYRILKHHLPGKYTFILPATKEVPKALQSAKKTVGLRIPENPICMALLKEMGHPLTSTTVTRAPEDADSYFNDPDEIEQAFGHSVEIFLDAGTLLGGPSTVVDLTGDAPHIIRPGSGDSRWLNP